MQLDAKLIQNGQSLQTDEAIQEAAIVLLKQARRQVFIRSAALDPILFDSIEFNEALSEFARQSRVCQVKILIDFPERVLKQGHRCLELARRLSDKIAIKAYFDEPDELRESLIITDKQGILIKPNSATALAYYSATDKIANQALTELFKSDWQLSREARELRQLSI